MSTNCFFVNWFTVLGAWLLWETQVCDSATATFSANGIVGEVTLISGNITVHLDLSTFSGFQLPGGSFTSCFGSNSDNINWYIRTNWTHDAMTDALSTSCDTQFTGHRYDPWRACSTESSNSYCSDSPVAGESTCVFPGSLGWADSEYDPWGSYDCNPVRFWNPYRCEVGDLSGKYGTLTYDEEKEWISDTFSSAFELDSELAAGMSIVFTCSNGNEAFCAPFQSASSTNDVMQNRIKQGEEDSSTRAVSKLATINDNTRVLLSNNGTYHITFDPTEMYIPPGCGNVLYRVYTFDPEVWEVATTCADKVADLFDPTVTCATGSVNLDKGLCSSEYQLCWDTLYEYDCDWDSSNWISTCALGDLSSKYGEISSAGGEVSGVDDFMVSLNSLSDTSVVFQCSDSYEIVACAKFEDCSSCSNISFGSNNNSTADATETWIIILLIFLALGAVYLYWRNQKQKTGPPPAAVAAGVVAGGAVGTAAAAGAAGGGIVRTQTYSQSQSATGPMPKPHHATASTIAGPAALRAARKDHNGPVGGGYGLGADRQVRNPSVANRNFMGGSQYGGSQFGPSAQGSQYAPSVRGSQYAPSQGAPSEYGSEYAASVAPADPNPQRPQYQDYPEYPDDVASQHINSQYGGNPQDPRNQMNMNMDPRDPRNMQNMQNMQNPQNAPYVDDMGQMGQMNDMNDMNDMNEMGRMDRMDRMDQMSQYGGGSQYGGDQYGPDRGYDNYQGSQYGGSQYREVAQNAPYEQNEYRPEQYGGSQYGGGSQYAPSMAPSDMPSQYDPDNPYNPYNNGPVAFAAAMANNNDPSQGRSLYDQKYGSLNATRAGSRVGSRAGGSQYAGSVVGSVASHGGRPLKMPKKRTQPAMSSGPMM